MSFYIEDNRGRILRPLLEYSKQEIISIIEALGYDHVLIFLIPILNLKEIS